MEMAFKGGEYYLLLDNVIFLESAPGLNGWLAKIKEKKTYANPQALIISQALKH